MRARVLVLRLPGGTFTSKEISAMGRELLRRALSDREWDDGSLPAISKGEHGKPYFPDHPETEFNISHSGRYIVAAVADVPVGIDVQEVRDLDCGKIGRRVFSDDEYRRYLLGPDRREMFFRSWVRKEAYVKWTGEGLMRDLRTLPMDGWYQFIEIDPGCCCAIQAQVPLRVEVEEVRIDE